MRRITITFLFCSVLLSAFAQEDTVAEKPVVPVKSYFSASLSYLTNSVYNGRQDSSSTPYITPMIGYYDKSGFFIDASLSYLAKSGNGRVDLVNFEAGYDYSIGNFDGEVSANKSFYNSASTNVKSEIAGSLFATGEYDFTYIKPTIEAGINFGKKNDYMVSFGLEHSFYWFDDKLEITPAFLGNGSTQNYYGSYYNERKVGGKRKKIVKAGITYNVSASVANASQFKMLDYEFSLPFLYVLNKKISFVLTPVLALPVNPAYVTVVTTASAGPSPAPKSYTEAINNTFFCSFGMSYRF